MIYPHPKPKPGRGIGDKKSGASRMYRDGRIVLSQSHWIKLKHWSWCVWTFIASDGVPRCHICEKYIWKYDDFEPDHIDPRGLGGGRRDDRFIRPSHSWCNREKGSIRNYKRGL